ncbi:MAG: fibronectin-binding autotransporter adhesin [Chthoniobacter sp.]|jgi:hypothetical protein|nr:fibronectin-binding autotransporter adhesin [Chthoniobacter sp.]
MTILQHQIERHAIVVALIGAMLALATPSQTKGGSIITFTFTNDATSQIDSKKTYLVKADPGPNPTAATVNGVAFERGTLAGAYTASNLSYALNAGAAGVLVLNAGNGNDLPSGASAALLNDLLLTSGDAGTAGNVSTLTFSGLKPGVSYSVRIYYRQWSGANPRDNTLFFDEDGPGPLGASSGVISEDAGSPDGTANVIGYNFKAQSNGSGGALPLLVTFTQAVANNSWHLYAVTNEVVP